VFRLLVYQDFSQLNSMFILSSHRIKDEIIRNRFLELRLLNQNCFLIYIRIFDLDGISNNIENYIDRIKLRKS
jgi:hypothetical protein